LREAALPNSSVNNPERWRERAEECRTLAELMSDPGAKNAMFEVAAAYDRLAEKIEALLPALSASPSRAFPSRSS